MIIMFLSITYDNMIWTQKNLMFRFYNSTKKQWELNYEDKGGLNVGNYEEITNICNSFPDKWDVIEVDQYLNVEDKNKKPLYEWDYFKFEWGNVIYVACWDEEEKKNIYKPVIIPSRVKIDIRELHAPLFESVNYNPKASLEERVETLAECVSLLSKSLLWLGKKIEERMDAQDEVVEELVECCTNLIEDVEDLNEEVFPYCND